MHLIEADRQAREYALDITRSYIVQAPAGSGKTELLMQRFLQLLAHAEKVPEEILAITFTRKAAQEMRERILKALQFADNPPPDNPHEKKRWQLARAVKDRDALLDWQLTQNPHRLQIRTIDALCAKLVNMMPILSRFGGPTDTTELPIPLYEEAIVDLFSELDSPVRKPLDNLILHCDNRYERLKSLLMDLLGKRDQWLPYVLAAQQPAELKAHLESALKQLFDDMLEQVETTCPDGIRETLTVSLLFASKHCQKTDSPIAQYRLNNTSLHFWRASANLLLTKEDWRKKLDKNLGFPANAKIEKQRCLDMLETLSEEKSFKNALIEIRDLPDSPAYTTLQWQSLCDLMTVLRRLCQLLQLVFKKHSSVDFIEMSLQALAALGSSDCPTDLARYLDHQISHILIDEFQDTAITQSHLIEKILQHWQPDAGKTLFLVGDPMQSIYRFRRAEVALFLSAQRAGIAGIDLEALYLRENFRSQKKIVDWHNTYMKMIFPAESHIEMGAVHYSEAVSQKINLLASVTGTYANSSDSEAHQLIDQIKTYQTEHPEWRIAILVRSRKHLQAILPHLQQANLRYQASEIDDLTNDPDIQDLLSLTTALHYPAERLAWLSVLRSPWVGITLRDLTVIAEQGPCIYENLLQTECLQKLTEAGQLRLASRLPILTQAMNRFAKIPLYDCLYGTWRELNLNQPLSRSSRVFFECLERCATGARLTDLNRLCLQLKKAYLPMQNDPGAIQIMTIHKSKGLEFDVVFLPACERKTRATEQALLLFEERALENGQTHLLLAPIPAKSQATDPIYQLLLKRQKKRDRHELKRLFYVATTRAKQHLHLSAVWQTGNPIYQESFLGLIHPKNADYFSQTMPSKISAKIDTQSLTIPRLKRLTQSALDEATQSAKSVNYLETDYRNAALTAKDYHWRHDPASAIGTLYHDIVARIAQADLAKTFSDTIEQLLPAWQIQLANLGVNPTQMQASLARLQTAIQVTLRCDIGQWILKKRPQSYSEYALTVLTGNEANTYRLDRYFIENDTAWIIDYKIASPNEDESIEAFTERIKSQYAPQLTRYRELIANQHPGEIKTALYLPLSPSKWLELSPSLAFF